MVIARPAARAAWPVLIAGTALVTAVPAATAVTGALDAAVGRVLVRTVLDLAVAGVLAPVVLASAGGPGARRERLLDAAAIAAAVWTLSGAATAFLLYLTQAPDPASPAFGPGLVAFVGEVPVGRAWLATTIGAAVLTALLVGARTAVGARAALVLAVAAVLPVVAQSPAPGSSAAGARIAFDAELVRLLATAVWAGLVAVTAAAPGRRGPARRTVAAWIALGLAAAGTSLAVAASAPAGGTTPLLALRVVLLLLALGCAAGSVRRPGLSSARTAGVLLGAVLGLSAAGAVLRPAGTTPPRTTPAEILTGAPLPARLDPARLLTAWAPDPLWITVAVGLLVAGFAVRRRGALRSPAGLLTLLPGVLLLVWLTSGAPAVYAPVLTSVWLVQHAALLVVVPALLVLAAPVRAAGPVPAAPPLLAAAVVLCGALLLLVPPVLRWTVADPLGSAWSILQCLASGVVLADAIVHGRARSAVVAASGTALAVVAAAAWAASSGGLLLAGWFGAMGWGVDARIDQRTGLLVVALLAVVPLLLLVARRRGRAPGVDRTPGEPVRAAEAAA